MTASKNVWRGLSRSIRCSCSVDRSPRVCCRSSDLAHPSGEGETVRPAEHDVGVGWGDRLAAALELDEVDAVEVPQAGTCDGQPVDRSAGDHLHRHRVLADALLGAVGAVTLAARAVSSPAPA